jgi:putative phage-type endonuclease
MEIGGGIGDMEQRTPEWFEARKGRITASAVGAIMGRAPYASRDDIMRRMVRESCGAESEFSGNIATEYGTNNEAGALVEYQMETGDTVDAVGFVTREDWAGCSPDGLIGDDGGLEIKCPFGLRKDEDPKFKALIDQPHYYDQVQFSLWVTGRAWWRFFQWSAHGTALEKVLPDQSWRDEKLPKLRQFYAEYLDACKDPDDYLAEKRVTIDTPEAAMIIGEYDQICGAIDNATARKAELVANMVQMAGEKNALIAGRKLTLTKRSGSISYAKAIKELAPDADLEKWRGKPSQSWGVK